MLKTILSLSFVVASRFFGLFIILPVFSLYASSMKGSNAMLAGIAIGIYALMQMLFQVPFGILSDKIGRKNMMSLGLIIFIIYTGHAPGNTAYKFVVKRARHIS